MNTVILGEPLKQPSKHQKWADARWCGHWTVIHGLHPDVEELRGSWRARRRALTPLRSSAELVRTLIRRTVQLYSTAVTQLYYY